MTPVEGMREHPAMTSAAERMAERVAGDSAEICCQAGRGSGFRVAASEPRCVWPVHSRHIGGSDIV